MLGTPEISAFSCIEGALDDLTQLGELERLVEVGVGSVERRRHLIQRLADPGEHDDSGMSQRDRLSHLFADFPATHAGHHHIQDDQVGELPVSELPCLISIGGFDDAVAASFQVTSNERQCAGFVVCDEDERHLCLRHRMGCSGLARFCEVSESRASLTAHSAPKIGGSVKIRAREDHLSERVPRGLCGRL